MQNEPSHITAPRDGQGQTKFGRALSYLAKLNAAVTRVAGYLVVPHGEDARISLIELMDLESA